MSAAEKVFDVDGRRVIVGSPPGLIQRFKFEFYLLLLGSPLIGTKLKLLCMDSMLAMILKQRSFLAIAVSRMSRSPRLAYFCICCFLSLPDEILESDPGLTGKFRDVLFANKNMRTRLAECQTSILVCFLS